MSFRDQWSAFRDERTGRLWRRYQWWWLMGCCIIPLCDKEFSRYRFIEVTSMADPEHQRIFLYAGNR